MAMQSSVFEKVREFVGVIKYAFAAQQLTEPGGWPLVKKNKILKNKNKHLSKTHASNLSN